MQPRAFVVMPFNRKPSGRPGVDVDFNAVFNQLFQPALQEAGYDVARADSERSAGDIRTDMFFELVTADLVVADVSVVNANVFYELGVRHGVCPRGVFVVANDSMPPAPFDIAPDRIFPYDAKPFECPGEQTDPPAPSAESLTKSIASLAKTFKDAGALDQHVIASPVYSHLSGLVPVNWEGIETSRSRYFTGLGADWLDRVRRAQARGRPGNILTLAMNAPTRLHETRILYEAAKALIDLSRYAAAVKVLRDVIRLDPDHAEAKIQLAMVLSKLDEIPTAEHELRKLSREYKDRPRAANHLGQVFRHLWHLSWRIKGQTLDRSVCRRKARDASQLATSAVHSFLRAHRADPRAYYAGFNALMLLHLLKEIEMPNWQLQTNVEELKGVTRYVARHELQQAIEEGNYEDQFWSTTTLAGILLIEGDHETALAEIRAACAIPAASSFQLQSFRDRLVLLDELDVHLDFVTDALKIVDQAVTDRSSHCSCQRVFLWAGVSTDQAASREQSLPPSSVEALTGAMRKVLREKCDMKEGDLGICSGNNESDLLFAETCLELKARVRILMREPIGKELNRPLWPFAEAEWNERFHRLVPGVPARADDRREIWFDSEELGKAGEGSESIRPETPVTRLAQWLINTAEMEAEPETSVGKPVAEHPQSAGPRLHGVFLWNGQATSDQAFLIRRVNQFNGYRGQVHLVEPVQRDSTPIS